MLVDIDMLFVLSNQILVKIYDFVFIADIEFEKLSSFCSSCKIIRYDISKYRWHLDDFNNIIKPPTILSKHADVQYKHVTVYKKI